jgi:hypothetical protein
MLLANAGVPMIFWQLPAMLMALPAVIAIEMLLARFRYQIPLRANLKGVSLSNIASTVIGVPLAWLTMLALNILTTGTRAMGLNTPLGVFQSVVLQSSWLVPYREQLTWMIPTATLVLLVPYFFASVYSERFALRFIWTDFPRETIRSFTWFGNLITYACFFIYTCVWLILAANAV